MSPIETDISILTEPVIESYKHKGDTTKMITQIDALDKLSKDIKSASTTLSDQEARYLVDTYYQMQDYRKRSDNQCRKLTATSNNEPHETLAFFAKNFETLENNIKSVLKTYAESKAVGQWMMSITGIGPVITAGLLAHIDIKKVNTAGEIQSYAGLDPTKPWLGKEKATKLINDLWTKYEFKSKNLGDKDCNFSTQELLFFDELSQLTGRKPEKLKAFAISANDEKPKSHKENLTKKLAMPPYNSELKTLVWKIGQSFVKVCNKDSDFYGKIYKERKEYEIVKNEKGEYAEQAAQKLKNFKIGKDTDAYKYYSQGKLPPSHIQQRAERYAVKIFLSHLFSVWYEIDRGCKSPRPYAISILGHAHEIEIPNWVTQ